MNAERLNFLRSQIVGVSQKVPTLNGDSPYINFDHAATTPPLKPVAQALESFSPWYSSIHRGFGFKSQFSTELYNLIRDNIPRFFKGSPQEYMVVFVKNTTEALNKLSYRFPNQGRVLTTKMEHHSNDLPWRVKHQTEFIRLTKEGLLDLEDFEEQLKKGGVSLVTVCGASNVTGVINPIYTLAEMAHYYGAKISIDGAQLVPHRPVALTNPTACIDFLSFSGHKIYAPYGSGVLLGERRIFEEGHPEYLGGGTVISVTDEQITLAPPPDRDEAGTPNLLGAFALNQAMIWLTKHDFPGLTAYEEELTSYAYQQLTKIPGVILYGPSPEQHRRVGVITFNLPEVPHGLTAAALAYEAGIGVRHGCFCARPYVHHLLGLRPNQIREYEALAQNGDKPKLPGLVRISFAFYNTRQEVEQFIKALRYIAENKARIKKEYRLDFQTGEYSPRKGGELFAIHLKKLLQNYGCF